MIRSRAGRSRQGPLRRLGAFLALAGCSVALTACGTPLIPALPPSSSTTATATPAPAPTATPSTTAPGTPTPGQSDSATPCSVAGVTFALNDRPGDSGAGSFFWDLRLTNAGDEVCLVSGHPDVVLIAADTGQRIGAASGLEPRAAPAELRLEPGDSAYSLLHLTQAGAYGCPLVAVDALAVTVSPGDTFAAVAAPHPIQGCDDPAIQLVRTGAFAAEPVTF